MLTLDTVCMNSNISEAMMFQAQISKMCPSPSRTVAAMRRWRRGSKPEPRGAPMPATSVRKAREGVQGAGGCSLEAGANHARICPLRMDPTGTEPGKVWNQPGRLPGLVVLYPPFIIEALTLKDRESGKALCSNEALT